MFETGDARYLPTGHIVYYSFSGDDLCGIAFDLSAIRLKGGPITMVEGVYRPSGAPHFAVSDSGTLAYIPVIQGGAAAGGRTLVWVDRKGKEGLITYTPDDYRFPRISPDGTQAVLAVWNATGSNIWIRNLIRDTLIPLTFDAAGSNYYPLWTPDGERIAFYSVREGSNRAVYWKAADGTGKAEPLVLPDKPTFPWSWSGDGKTLLMMEWNALSSEGWVNGKHIPDRSAKNKLNRVLFELVDDYHRAIENIVIDPPFVSFTWHTKSTKHNFEAHGCSIFEIDETALISRLWMYFDTAPFRAMGMQL